MKNSTKKYFGVIGEMIDRGGPEVAEYEYLKQVPKELSDLPIQEQVEVFEILKPLLTVNSMLGFTFQKPHGYAGDYELIDRIYSQWKSADASLVKWDIFFHSLEAAEAVRNRTKYFQGMANYIETQHKNARVLNLGSGPCCDLIEFLNSKPKHEHTIKFECLDMDKAAIAYGASVCNDYLDFILFINKNALRFNPGYQYNLIWSAGLFDYFNDKIFIRMVKKMYALVTTGGELVIGNMSIDNPSKEIMEVFGQWYLYHRSKDSLIELAMEAGVQKDLIKISQEELGVNLFLHLKKAEE